MIFSTPADWEANAAGIIRARARLRAGLRLRGEARPIAAGARRKRRAERVLLASSLKAARSSIPFLPASSRAVPPASTPSTARPPIRKRRRWPSPVVLRFSRYVGLKAERHGFARPKASTRSASSGSPRGRDGARSDQHAGQRHGAGGAGRAALELAERHGATSRVVVGEALLTKNFPLIHAVGRASAQAPRLVDFFTDPRTR